MEDNTNITKLTLRNTDFIAEAAFSEDAKETACDKIKRLIKNSLEFPSASIQDTSAK
jgi:hypothetical protein